MTINDVLFFDTETTGIPERSWEWHTDYAKYPHVVQMAWIHGCKVESHIIRPDGWEIPEDAIKVHGITMERAMNEGEPFAAIVDRFIQDCHDAAHDEMGGCADGKRTFEISKPFRIVRALFPRRNVPGS